MGSSSSKNKYKNSVTPKEASKWKNFPTYERLRKAQWEYAQKGQQPEQPAHLKPFPPPTPRSQVFTPHQYEDIDDHARKAPLHLAADSYEALVSYLTEPATNDIGRVRAFYSWIAAQDPDAVTLYTDGVTPSQETPLYPLLVTLLKKWRKGYTYLLFHLCKTANISCQRVRGLVKGARYEAGKPVTGRNTYCIVYVDGAWRFIDQHWGSASASGKKKVSNINNNAEDIEEEFTMQYEADDFWFLTDPEIMIFTHFPDDPAHQLLAKPVTEEEFQKMANVNEHFFQMGFTTVMPPVCELRTDSGEIGVTLNVDKHRYYDFQYDLRRYGDDGPTIRTYKNIFYNQMVFMVAGERQLNLHMEFPEIGKYRLEINAKDIEDSDGPFTKIVQYIIRCKVPHFDYKVYPYHNDFRWGLFGEGRLLGLSTSVTDGIIYAPEGTAEFRIVIPKNGKDILLQEYVENPTYSREHMEQYTCQYRVGKEVVVLLKLPEHGNYVCHVYARESGEDEELRQLVCRYLVVCSKGCADMAPYPSVTVGQGTNNIIKWSNKSPVMPTSAPKRTDSSKESTVLNKYPTIIPVSHKHPVIDDITDGKVTIIMETQNCENIVFNTCLRHQLEEDKTEEYTEYVIVHRTPDTLKYHIRFPKSGFYSLNIHYRRMDSKSDRHQFGFAYLIYVLSPMRDCVPFPALSMDWQDEYELMQPQDGILQANTTTEFKVRVKDAKAVWVHSTVNDNEQHLKPHGKDVWGGDVKTGNANADLSLYSKTSLDDIRVLLATYKVVDDSWLNALRESQEKRLDSAQRHREEVDKRRKALESAADHRRRQEEEAIRMREKEYERERDERERAERMREERERMMAARTPARTVDDGLLDTSIDDAYLEEVARDRKYKWDRHEQNLEIWRKYHEDMIHKMAADRLRDALNKRERGLLQRALADCEQNYSEEYKGDMRRAEDTLRILSARERLHKAIQKGKTTKILAEIDSIENSNPNIKKYLRYDLREARYYVERLIRLERLHTSILDMDRKTMTEVRRYSKPPPRVHRVIQAALLMLGQDEEATAEWKGCQKMLNPQGMQGLHRKVMNFTVEGVSPEISARAREILEEQPLPEVRNVSHGAGTFWVWTMGIVEEVEKFHQKKGEDLSKIKPADLQRQKEILTPFIAPPPQMMFTGSSPVPKTRRALTVYTSHGDTVDSYDPLRTSLLTSPRDPYIDRRHVSPVRSSTVQPLWT